MATTQFKGPVTAGTIKETSGDGTLVKNTGTVVLAQTASVSQTAAGTTNATIYLPASAQITDFNVDLITQWNSATSAALTVGTTSAGAQYVTSIDVKTATTGRQALTLTGAQVLAMSGISSNTSVVATVASVGTTTTGSAIITVFYIQN
jgi:hypothetical protein